MEIDCIKVVGECSGLWGGLVMNVAYSMPRAPIACEKIYKYIHICLFDSCTWYSAGETVPVTCMLQAPKLI